jgi:hypothetical protein
MMQGIVRLNSFIKQVVFIIFSVEIHLPLPEFAKYRDVGGELPFSEDWRVGRLLRRGY